MQTFTLFVILSTAPLIVMAEVGTVKDVSEYLKTCYLTDKTQLNQCLTDYFTKAIPLLASGIDGGPRLDPLQLGDFKLPEIGIFLNGKMTYDQLTLTGLSKATITDIATDTSNLTITVDMDIPLLRLDSSYHFDSTILFTPVVGKGTYATNLFGNNVTMVLKLERYGNSLKLVDFDIKATPSKLKVSFENLMGSKDTSDTIHKMIDENGVTLYKEIRSYLEKQYSNSAIKVYEPLMKDFPTKVFAHT